ncbi:MAG TPA: hypothetical protein VEO00_07295, partial [Actinomycetota bacterium]|nr:hypothetical protein [Actinomycetota bacterium]
MSADRSTNTTPSRNAETNPRAASTARRVFPVPPGPVRVTRRDDPTRSRTAWSSAARPTND